MRRRLLAMGTIELTPTPSVAHESEEVTRGHTSLSPQSGFESHSDAVT